MKSVVVSATPEAESKEIHGVWDTMPEKTITSPYGDSSGRLQHMYHWQPYARVNLNPMPELILSPPVTLTKKKIKFSSYIRKFRKHGCKAKDWRPPHIWVNICAFPHTLGSPSSYMTLQPIPSEFPYRWGKFRFLFYQCRDLGFGPWGEAACNRKLWLNWPIPRRNPIEFNLRKSAEIYGEWKCISLCGLFRS